MKWVMRSSNSQLYLKGIFSSHYEKWLREISLCATSAETWFEKKKKTVTLILYQFGVALIDCAKNNISEIQFLLHWTYIQSKVVLLLIFQCQILLKQQATKLF